AGGGRPGVVPLPPHPPAGGPGAPGSGGRSGRDRGGGGRRRLVPMISDKPVLPQGEAKVRAVDDMFDAIAPRYDTLNRLLTLRMDVGWRKKTVRSLALPPGAVVLDLACGTGDLCRVLEGAGYRPVGVDRSAGMLAAAQTSAPLVRGDALALPVGDGSVDGITCGFALRNVL